MPLPEATALADLGAAPLGKGEVLLKALDSGEVGMNQVNLGKAAYADYVAGLKERVFPSGGEIKMWVDGSLSRVDAFGTQMDLFPATGRTGVVELEVGPYGKLASRSVGDGLTPDHSPSYAAILASVERAQGPLTPAERQHLHSVTNTIIIRTSSHMSSSRTYGGRNTPAVIHMDSWDLAGALPRDRAAMNSRLILDGHSQAAIEAAYKRLDQLNRQDGWY